MGKDRTGPRRGDRRSAIRRSDEAVPDKELVSAYLAGEKSAFSAIVARHSPRLLWVARRYARDEEDARDILQEAFLKASQRLHTFRFEAQLGTWLYRLVANQGYDHATSRHRCEESTLDAEDDSQRHALSLAHDPTPHTDLGLLLSHALGRIRQDQAEALVLVDAVGWSVAQVAAAHGVPPGTVKSRRSRAKTALRELLEDGAC